MKYKFINNKWLGLITSNVSVNQLAVLMDTGAQSTSLRLETVADLKGWSVPELEKYLKDKQSISLVVANGSKSRGVPCHLENITIAGELIKNFFCVVPTDKDSLKLNLIGADILNSYSRVTKDDGFFVWSGLNERKYATYFKSRCSSVVPSWLGSIETTLLVDDIVDLKVYAPNCVEWATRHNYNKEAFRLALFKVIDKHRITTLEALEAIIAEIDK